ncbi:MAG: primosomal protein N' [Bacilli bacterium]|jgi:primosomal protein N' (replication factor Y)|nr:primosomal protein N' [Bacilli bacterium]
MQIVSVLIEHPTISLNRPFSYGYNGEKKIVIGERVLVPFNNRDLIGYVIDVELTTRSVEELEDEKGFRVLMVKQVIDSKPLLSLELMELSQQVADYYIAPKISVLQAMLPPTLRPASSSLKQPKIAYEDYLVFIRDEEKLSPKQKEILLLIKENSPVKKREIKSPTIIKKLLDLDLIKIEKKEKIRFSIPDEKTVVAPPLTVDQNQVIDEFCKSDDRVFLLEGITGSGKTEVYLALAERTLKTGKNVLMLVPEIALTPMMVAHFVSRYHQDVAVLHSELTPAEKYDEYRRIAEGKVRIVVGVRSAIFAPLSNIGLIILDEEHVESYKQDTLPFYHAREVAIMRAMPLKAKVLLGSATPSLESRARALKGVYHLLQLKQRINKRELPVTEIVDLMDANNLYPQSIIFSKQLVAELKTVIERHEQAILLINRRGYATYVSCRQCGYVFRCPQDDMVLTYHRSDKLLKCHHCDYVEELPAVCPQCGSKHLWQTGFGTERVEDEIHKFFPKVRTLRLDSDTSKVRSQVGKIVKSFANHEADILIGTQMIAKGHDFPLVTLVGVILADMGLYYPSYRSAEQTFQLITQAVGRSGRKDRPGKAIIQTNMPGHYAIVLGSKQDYASFFATEMKIRKLSNDSPFSFEMIISLLSKNAEVLDEAIMQLASDMKNAIKEFGEVLGPTTPFYNREREYYRRILIIKHRNYFRIRPIIAKLVFPLAANSKFQVKIDVDSFEI